MNKLRSWIRQHPLLTLAIGLFGIMMMLMFMHPSAFVGAIFILIFLGILLVFLMGLTRSPSEKRRSGQYLNQDPRQPRTSTPNGMKDLMFILALAVMAFIMFLSQ